MDKNSLLRSLPQIDKIIKNDSLQGYNCKLIIDSSREIIEKIRQEIIDEKLSTLPSEKDMVNAIIEKLEKYHTPSLKKVINATGVVLHTNLGRSCISKEAAQAAYDAATSYSTLEYDLENKKRGSRLSGVEKLLTAITGAEAAAVVNNNAAAVFLVLTSLLKGKEVVISRGELVEIGGSFRIPEIMEQSQSIMKEIGTTNKTHLYDYQRAINENAGALLKVHTSNYKIIGFTETVALDELVKLAHKNNILVIEDLGSGAIQSLSSLNIDEPYISQSIKSGVDIVCVSGDKLMGGPQAGIILGKKELISKIKNHPLMRILRLDKMTLAALEISLMHYRDGIEYEKIPTLKMINQDLNSIYLKAIRLKEMINCDNIINIIETDSKIGGGSTPETPIPSFAIELNIDNMSCNQIEKKLRLGTIPIIGRIINNKFTLDLRTIFDEDMDIISHLVRKLIYE